MTEGLLEQLYAQHRVASLDEQMEWFDTDEVEEPPVKPILPTEAAPVRDPQQRAQVDTLLSYLSLRAQAILRLRYGLCDDNERRHTTNEIARLLGLDRRLILTTERDALYTLFYEYYRGYTIYSTQEGRCCIHGKQGCIKLRGKYVCFPDFEDAKTLIKRFRAEGYTSSDSVERSVPESEYVCLNWREPPRSPMSSSPMQRVS